MACLTLVAPSGMTAADRRAWVEVARKTLSGIPADLLERGCRHARETCDHPSKIVPAILKEVRSAWDWRKRRLAEERARVANANAPRLEAPTFEPVPHETTQAIIREVTESLKVKA